MDAAVDAEEEPDPDDGEQDQNNPDDDQDGDSPHDFIREDHGAPGFSAVAGKGGVAHAKEFPQLRGEAGICDTRNGRAMRGPSGLFRALYTDRTVASRNFPASLTAAANPAIFDGTRCAHGD